MISATLSKLKNSIFRNLHLKKTDQNISEELKILKNYLLAIVTIKQLIILEPTQRRIYDFGALGTHILVPLFFSVSFVTLLQ